jgi:RND family efflux transporter MFP subunit
MKTRTLLLLMALLATASFLAGLLVSRQHGSATGSAPRKILYYVDPMHPSYKSDKPGIAPDCGMQLEPVYADGNPARTDGEKAATADLPAGTIQIGQDKQQLIGVKTAAVEKAPWSHTVRVLGRVAPDEARLYRINAATEMWVRKVYGPTTGSMVKKDDPLMAFYTTALISSAASYMYALETQDRQRESNMLNPDQQTVTNFQIRQAVDSLLNIGVSQRQVDDMAKSRKPDSLVDVRSPASGIILARTVTLGQWVGPGTELYRIADLSRVWIFADVFENEAALFKAGMGVRVTLPSMGKQFTARVSAALPQFDPQTRALKVRLEADNQGYLMRPDMFVDIELPVSGAAAVTVPMEAVLDSGLKKTVFVDRGNGYFEPRRVETGRHLGERVEIVRGLMPGEKIVVSGTFLIDSESRLKSAAAGITGTPGRDPVCGMDIDQEKARASGRISTYRGTDYYFCSPECAQTFGRSPQRYSAGTQAAVPDREQEKSHPGMPRHD